jgi:nitroreductase
MDLSTALRTTGAIREFTDEPVSDEVLARLLDAARFAPSGGNRQGWRVVVVRDPETRRRLRDLYLRGWYDYLAMTVHGLVAWSPRNDRAAEHAALPDAARLAEDAAAGPGGFAEHLDEVPALLVLLADLAALSAIDRDHERYSFAGGASVYPFAWSLLLAARGEGLGGVMTTVALREEDAVCGLLGVPDGFALAAVVALGHPVDAPRRLRRRPVESFATVDRFDGPPLAAR